MNGDDTARGTATGDIAVVDREAAEAQAPDERRCALPGCSLLIEHPEAGGAPRRYCSSTHRSIARRQRQIERLGGMEPAEGHSDTDDHTDTDLFAAESWSLDDTTNVATTAFAQPSAGTDAEPATTVYATADPRARSRRTSTRALVALAAASVVIGGGGYLAGVLSPSDPAPGQPQAVAQVDGLPDEVGQWATRAEATRAALDRQLGDLTATETAWTQLPPARRGTALPPQVQALQARKATLTQQRDTLTTQLAAVRALPAAEQELATAQTQLDDVQRTLAQGAPATSAGQTLTDQRVTQRDRSRTKLDVLRASITAAMALPLPTVDDAATRASIDAVRALLDATPSAPGHAPTGAAPAAPVPPVAGPPPAPPAVPGPSAPGSGSTPPAAGPSEPGPTGPGPSDSTPSGSGSNSEGTDPGHPASPDPAPSNPPANDPPSNDPAPAGPPPADPVPGGHDNDHGGPGDQGHDHGRGDHHRWEHSRGPRLGDALGW